jgi:DNA invertase Pin-like site-specific DNA recombinase
MNRPPIINPSHLARDADGYGRQSTADQVEKNTGSTEYQRGQLRYAREWGWPEERIVWHDDFGLTGAAAEHRAGYQCLKGRVQQGRVGMVLVSDLSRLGREAAELLSFLADCAAHNVLIAVDGRVVDPRDPSDWLMNALQAILSQHGGNNIRDTLQRGRIAKLEAGMAVSYPPVGYDQGPRKEWIMTADAAVRMAIVTIFRVYFEECTLRRTVVRLLELGVKIPRRKPGHPITWRDPEIGVLKDMIGNPNYTPDYYYRRHVDDHTKPRSAKGRRRPRKAKPEEIKVIGDHHEGYITRDQWAEIRAICERNAWSRQHSHLADGPGLTGGVIFCGLHAGWRMGVRYKRGGKWTRSHTYTCRGRYGRGGKTCQRISGARLDDAVVTAVLGRMGPPSVDAVREAFQQAVADTRSQQRHRQIERARLEQRIVDLEQKLELLDASSLHVFKTLERRVEQAQTDLEKLQEIGDAERRRSLQADAAMLDEAIALAADVRRVFEASTTRNRDRKELIRFFVPRVTLEGYDNERARIRIQWADGAPDVVVWAWLEDGIARMMDEMFAEGVSDAEIAQKLNAMGIKTRVGNAFTAKAVRAAVLGRARKARKAKEAGGQTRLPASDPTAAVQEGL